MAARERDRVRADRHRPRAARLAGVPTRKLFNTSGESYRAGNYGKLIKRPLALGGGIALIGFEEAAWRAALR